MRPKMEVSWNFNCLHTFWRRSGNSESLLQISHVFSDMVFDLTILRQTFQDTCFVRVISDACVGVYP